MRHHGLTILVTEAAPGDCDASADGLAASGHRIHRCHPVHDPASPSDARCMAWRPGGRCPLTTADVDLVVDVRSAHGPETSREQGAMCALLAGIPLVVCGPTDATNSMLLRADAICRPHRLASACDTALSPVGPTARRAVTRAARTALAGLSEPPPIAVDLELRGHTVVVDVTVAAAPCATTYPRVRSAVRMAMAAFTPAWPYTPVTVHHAEFTR
ncbi:hypothetical protein [Yinghuangia soli]|uniref:Uncharacterized protein n=1 Tax=Yinghuangia soli TaxID=2908204 RepID=A0AA41Q914_9ACTN|nr:hypothetical protein [Yinghuangia soli]MCF2533824.1 hypothetical protein [Yinghuangia soli]